MVVDDVIVNKSAAIERCIQRIQKICSQDPQRLLSDELALEATILNLQRACENALDLGMHLVRLKRLGIPQSSRNTFELLASAGIITSDLLARMKAMIGFRNIAVHEYNRLDVQIVISIVRDRLQDFMALVEAIKRA